MKYTYISTTSYKPYNKITSKAFFNNYLKQFTPNTNLCNFYLHQQQIIDKIIRIYTMHWGNNKYYAQHKSINKQHTSTKNLIKTPQKDKKTLIISSYDDLKNPVYSGGGAYCVHQLAKELSKKYNITVITGTYKNARNEKIDNINYIRVGSEIFGHKIGQLIFHYSILKYALKLKYDIWIESTMPPFTFSLLPFICRHKLIAWVNMLCAQDMQRKYKIKTQIIENELARHYKYIITPTDWVKNEIKKINSHALITTIPQGFDADEFKPTQKSNITNRNYFLSLGRIEINQKGLDLLLEAMKNTLPKINLIIAGGGGHNEEKKLKKIIKKDKLQNKIKIIGRISGENKKNLIQNSKGIILTSRFETFSLTALEAIMLQKPLICFKIPQLEWIPAKYSTKIKPFNTLELAKTMNKIWNGDYTPKISNYERTKYLNNFSWNAVSQKFSSIIENII